jgi:hypothetical protein
MADVAVEDHRQVFVFRGDAVLADLGRAEPGVQVAFHRSLDGVDRDRGAGHRLALQVEDAATQGHVVLRQPERQVGGLAQVAQPRRAVAVRRGDEQRRAPGPREAEPPLLVGPRPDLGGRIAFPAASRQIQLRPGDRLAVRPDHSAAERHRILVGVGGLFGCRLPGLRRGHGLLSFAGEGLAAEHAAYGEQPRREQGDGCDLGFDRKHGSGQSRRERGNVWWDHPGGRPTGRDQEPGTKGGVSEQGGHSRTVGAFRDGHGGEQGGEVDAAAGQPPSQLLPGSAHPALHGALLAPQLSGGVPPALALQHAQHERLAKTPRQALDLFVQDGLHVFPGRAGRPGRAGPQPAFVLAPPCRAALRLHGRSIRDPVQPTGDRVALPDRPGAPRQDEEGGLEGVLRVLLVPQHTPAHAQHHRPVAGDNRGEGRLVAPVGEVVQQLPVGPTSNAAAGGQLVDVPQERA